MTILAKLSKFVKENKNELVLFLAVVLISLLSFFCGYIAARLEEKKPLIVNYNEKYYQSYCFNS
ncbi:MAG TPA: hypothetical protein PKI00_02385 [Candidatus Pacearchaeota archaeon]|nr:hypothetical protein [Candidatus Parcubacteria bacterium]HNP79671.1 hypothetical protein [Candidatus Pacearchaeota archaeon]